MARPRKTPTQPYDHHGVRIYPPTDGSGHWRIAVTDNSGVRSFRRAKTQGRAEATAETLSAFAAGTQSIALANRTLAELAGAYLTELRTRAELGEVSLRYWEKQQGSLGRWVIPHVGDLRVAEWTVDASRGVILAAMEAGRAAETRKDIGAAMRQLVTFAHDKRWLGPHIDPMLKVRYATTPTRHGMKIEPIRRDRLPAEDDVQMLLKGYEATGQHRLGIAQALSARSGVRSGERAALRPIDFDFDRRIIAVDRQLIRPDTAPEYLGLPKYNKVRTTFFPASLAGPLQALCETVELSRGPEALIWPESDTVLRRHWIRAAQAAGWPFHHVDDPTPAQRQWPQPRWSLHDLRHFSACWMLFDIPMEAADVSYHLGHSSVAFTLAKYVGLRGDPEGRAKSLTEDW